MVNRVVQAMRQTSPIGEIMNGWMVKAMRLLRVVIWITLLNASCVWADSYSYHDNSTGVIYLTDNPDSENYALLVKSPDDAAISDSGDAKSLKKKLDIQKNLKREYEKIVENIGSVSGIEPELLHAVISVESDYNKNALSPKGALGLMQLMPETARRFGVTDRKNPVQNIAGGARYLSYLLNIFDKNITLALAAYNAGENAVIKYGYNVPPFKETENYVKNVSKIYAHHRQQAQK